MGRFRRDWCARVGAEDVVSAPRLPYAPGSGTRALCTWGSSGCSDLIGCRAHIVRTKRLAAISSIRKAHVFGECSAGRGSRYARARAAAQTHKRPSLVVVDGVVGESTYPLGQEGGSTPARHRVLPFAAACCGGERGERAHRRQPPGVVTQGGRGWSLANFRKLRSSQRRPVPRQSSVG